MIVKDSAKNFNCFKASWRYFFDKGIPLVLLNVIPTFLLAFIPSPSSTMYHVFDMAKVDATDLGELFKSMWSVSYSFWYLGIVGLVLLTVTGSITFGVIDRHMRVGEFTLSPRYFKTRLNFNLLTGVKFVIVVVFGIEFYCIVTTVLYYLWANVLGGFVATMVFNTVTLLVVELGTVTTISLFILWPPYMLHTGIKGFNAFKAAWSNMSGKTFQTVVGLFTIILPIQIVMAITAIFDVGTVCRTILDGFAYSVIVPFYLVLMYTVFYDVTGTERMDIEAKKQDIWNKK